MRAEKSRFQSYLSFSQHFTGESSKQNTILCVVCVAHSCPDFSAHRTPQGISRPDLSSRIRGLQVDVEISTIRHNFENHFFFTGKIECPATKSNFGTVPPNKQLWNTLSDCRVVASEAIGGTQKLSWDLRREIISPALINCKKRQNGFHHRGDRPRAQGRHQARLTKTQEEESRAGVVSKRQSRKEASSDEKDKDAQRAPRTAQEESTRVEHSQRTSMLQ